MVEVLIPMVLTLWVGVIVMAYKIASLREELRKHKSLMSEAERLALRERVERIRQHASR